MTPRRPIDDAAVEPFMRAALGSVSIAGGPEPLQLDVLDKLARHVFELDIDVTMLTPLDPAGAAEAIVGEPTRLRLVQMMVVLELLSHPVSPAATRCVHEYANALQVDEPMVHTARKLADGHMALMYADIMRNSYYTAEARHEVLHGHFW